MSDVLKIVLTAGLTALGGVVVFVIGQIVLKVMIEPILDLRKTIGEVETALVMYAGMVTSPATRDEGGAIENLDFRNEAKKTFRELASKLSASAFTVTWGYGLAHRWGLLPSRTDIRWARKSLIGLSNSAFPRTPGPGIQFMDEARKALGLPSQD